MHTSCPLIKPKPHLRPSTWDCRITAPPSWVFFPGWPQWINLPSWSSTFICVFSWFWGDKWSSPACSGCQRPGSLPKNYNTKTFPPLPRHLGWKRVETTIPTQGWMMRIYERNNPVKTQRARFILVNLACSIVGDDKVGLGARFWPKCPVFWLGGLHLMSFLPSCLLGGPSCSVVYSLQRARCRMGSFSAPRSFS